ncbi:MAG: beta-lactamase family protein [Lachnospiraceae bacterium]|nr:beta-lactamase family protein [Lachnospiraceae bacterium]
MILSFNDLNAYQNSLSKYGIGGNDLAVYVDFKPVYRYMTGWQNLEERREISRNTMYKMFSMTKPVAVTAAMQLYECGLYQMEDELSKYLPEFAEMKVYEKNALGDVRVVPAKNPIRIRHLFEMTAGFDYDKESPEMKKWIDEGNTDHTLADFVRLIATRPLQFEPGTHWRYSVAHDVLARFVEVLSGMTIGEYMKKYIFDPIGMSSATFHMTAEQERNLCERYQLGANGALVKEGPLRSLYCGRKMEGGGAGLVMTVDDYARFTAMLANRGVAENGERILAGATVDLIRENRLSGTVLSDFQTSSATRYGYGYGLGVRTLISRAAGASLSPVGEFGWSGMLGTYMLADPVNKVAMVFGTQATPASVHPPFKKTLKNLVYAALEYENVLK